MMAADSYNIAKVNFLVIEDSEHMRSLIRNILNALGAHLIREARDVRGAYELMGAFPIDIVICDWQMAPVSGLDFVKELRRNEESPYRFMPIIMLTAHSEMRRVTEARDAGVNEFVIKPISAKTLYTRIREIIKNPRPFIETQDYFGPDRRRKQTKYNGAERRAGKPTAEPSGDEVKALLNG
jgi:two-component system chemotaxis response regulator CheY